MINQTPHNQQQRPEGQTAVTLPFKLQRKTVIGIIMAIALLSFEMFNFDTTRYALQNLLGDVRFLGLQWAAILAIAFCAIDFAGLARLFTPQQGTEEPNSVWYLMGAWLLGATMNAIMTWWAISLTLLSHDFGNEILSRGELLQIVPIFVASLVWLTRILFIGAFSVAGEHLFDLAGTQRKMTAHQTNHPPSTVRSQPNSTQQPAKRQPVRRPVASRRTPSSGPTIRRTPAPMQARKRR